MNKEFFKGGLFETMLLDLISEKGSSGIHGYGIAVILRKKYGLCVGSSTLYPELNRMEESNFIESAWNIAFGRPRKVYQITQKGQHILQEYSTGLRIIVPAIACKTA